MYTSSKTLGIGKVTSETETSYIIFWEEKNKTTTTLKSYCKVYATECEAEAALDEKEAIAEAKKEDLYSGISNAGSNRMAEINRENAIKNTPSSLK